MAESAARSPWAGRFIGAAVVTGAGGFALMAALLYLAVFGQPAASRIVAGGGAGTWLVVGVIGYGLVAVLGTAVSALFYHHIEVVLRMPLAGWRRLAAWAHLIAGSGGAVAASLLIAYGGYLGGAALLPTSVGGGGQSALWVHEHVLGGLVVPIAAAMGVSLLGFLAGGMGYVASWRASTAGAETPLTEETPKPTG